MNRGNMKTGVERIAAERKRQIEEEHFDAEHDDEHDDHELAWAAVCYAAPGRVFIIDKGPYCLRWGDPWPGTWDEEWDKRLSQEDTGDEHDPETYTRETRISFLTKAGALIAAEIDRLNRAKAAEEDD